MTALSARVIIAPRWNGAMERRGGQGGRGLGMLINTAFRPILAEPYDTRMAQDADIMTILEGPCSWAARTK